MRLRMYKDARVAFDDDCWRFVARMKPAYKGRKLMIVNHFNKKSFLKCIA